MTRPSGSVTPRYRPIDCRWHSELELAALRGHPLVAVTRHAGRERIERLQLVDVRTRRGQEFLLVRRAPGAPLRWLRLDRLLRLEVDGVWHRVTRAE